MNEILIPQGLQIPYLDQYIGAWLMDPDVLNAKLSMLQSMNISLHIQQVKEEKENHLSQRSDGTPAPKKIGYGYQLDKNGIATIEIHGTLMKQESSGDTSTSTVKLRRDVRQAMDDEDCEGVMLLVESPGGTVAGAYELADDLYELAQKKPTSAYACDMCASGGYLMASQMGSISANRTAMVGSIGTRSAIVDSSARAKMMGLRVIPIDSTGAAGMKSAGAPGTEVTPAQQEYFQGLVNSQQNHFNDAIVRTGRMSDEKVSKVADGKVHLATDAKKLGLVDKVESYDSAYQGLVKKIQTGKIGKSPKGARQEIVQPSEIELVGGMIGGLDPASPSILSNKTIILTSAFQQLPARAEGQQPAEAEKISTEATTQESPMAEPTAPQAPAQAGPKPATISELKAAFPKDPEFSLSCAEKNMTLLEAKGAYSDILAERLAKSELANVEMQKKSAEKRPGGPGIKDGATTRAAITHAIEGDPVLQFEAKVEEFELSKKIGRGAAIKMVVHRHPELHMAYLAAINDTPLRQKQLETYSQCAEAVGHNWSDRAARAN